jgi:predicted kinase
MSKVVVLQAPPACGKTTKAREYVKGDKSKEWIIISKDSIRKSLGEFWILSREPLVRKIEWASAELAVEEGFNIVIDATNLREKDEARWKSFADKFGCELEFIKWALPYSEAMKRDQARKDKPGELSVGKKSMDYFYNTFFPELKDK